MDKHFYGIILSLLFACPSFAQEISSQKNSSSCSSPYGSEILNINNIEAKIFTGGDMHWDLFNTGNHYYRFPKGSNKNASGAAGIWIGGLDGGGQLKIAAQTYRQTGRDFWPGPLEISTASTDWTHCIRYDQIWKTDYKEITDFISNYKAGNVALNTYTPSESILNWPTEDTNFNWTITDLAPYRDINTDGKYNPKANGDYPKIKGDQELFYIFNDKGDIHTETGGQSIGLEIHASVYGYGCPTTIALYPELNNTTFYHYRIKNKTNYQYNKTYIAIWVDATIGGEHDDYIGSNVKEGYGYAYNADGNDSIYGNILPATATVLLKAPKADPNDGIDNDGDGIIDEPGEELSIPNFLYFLQNKFQSSSTPSVQMTNPELSSHFYNYMNGFWKDGSPFTCGGNAHGGTTPTKNVFPSNYPPIGACGSGWTETNAGNINFDRCYLLSVGPFTFTPNSETEFEIAFVTSVDSSSIGDPTGSINKLQTDVQKIKNFYALPVKPSCIDTNKVAKFIPNKISEITFYPNPIEQDLIINFGTYYQNLTSIKIYDVLGRLIYNEEFINIEETIIDLSYLSKAFYFVEATSGSTKFTKKLIKQ